MTTATEGHIYYIFESTIQKGLFKAGITNDLDRRHRQHGLDKWKLIDQFYLGAGNAFSTEQALLKKWQANRLNDCGEYLMLSDTELKSFIEDVLRIGNVYVREVVVYKQMPQVEEPKQIVQTKSEPFKVPLPVGIVIAFCFVLGICSFLGDLELKTTLTQPPQMEQTR